MHGLHKDSLCFYGFYVKIPDYRVPKSCRLVDPEMCIRDSIYCDVRKPIHLEEVTVTEDDVIFNFAAVHRTPGHSDHEYFETNTLRPCWTHQ